MIILEVCASVAYKITLMNGEHCICFLPFVYRSNIPKELLSYTGFPFPDHVTDSYIHHSVILEYLNTFARHYDMHQYIKVDLHFHVNAN